VTSFSIASGWVGVRVRVRVTVVFGCVDVEGGDLRLVGDVWSASGAGSGERGAENGKHEWCAFSFSVVERNNEGSPARRSIRKVSINIPTGQFPYFNAPTLHPR
jgi:hypothetical protein